jgi:hypothetical protein
MPMAKVQRKRAKEANAMQPDTNRLPLSQRNGVKTVNRPGVRTPIGVATY